MDASQLKLYDFLLIQVPDRMYVLSYKIMSISSLSQSSQRKISVSLLEKFVFHCGYAYNVRYLQRCYPLLMASMLLIITNALWSYLGLQTLLATAKIASLSTGVNRAFGQVPVRRKFFENF